MPSHCHCPMPHALCHSTLHCILYYTYTLYIILTILYITYVKPLSLPHAPCSVLLYTYSTVLYHSMLHALPWHKQCPMLCAILHSTTLYNSMPHTLPWYGLQYNTTNVVCFMKYKCSIYCTTLNRKTLFYNMQIIPELWKYSDQEQTVARYTHKFCNIVDM